nr:MAG TPA: hypothetical protein [Caudoviricetes sp.]
MIIPMLLVGILMGRMLAVRQYCYLSPRNCYIMGIYQL